MRKYTNYVFKREERPLRMLIFLLVLVSIKQSCFNPCFMQGIMGAVSLPAIPILLILSEAGENLILEFWGVVAS